jgi:hypothetical protein
MPLTPETDSKAIYLTIKHHKLWREVKKHVEGCKSIEVTNPSTKQVMTKYGYHYNDVEGHILALDSYKREYQGKRFAGFKLKMFDGTDTFYVDLPWKSIFLRKFMKVMHNINFRFPLKIAAWQSKERTSRGKEETAIWFTQGAVTVPYYFTKEHPNGLPEAKKDDITDEWDFREQEAWLVNRIKEDILPRIAEASKYVPKENELDMGSTESGESADASEPPPNNDYIDDDDVPF